MCLYSKLIPNPKYKKNKKNQGKVPFCRDERVLMVPIGCGKCMECRKQRARSWQIRLNEEIRVWGPKQRHFITLSFSEEALAELQEVVQKDASEQGITVEGYDLDNAVATLAFHRFRHRWNKRFGHAMKHWCITELGQTSTERIHIHGIAFTTELQAIRDLWQYGGVWIGSYVSERTVGYITKYLSKADHLHKAYTPKVLCSPGVGKAYKNRIDFKRHVYVPKQTKEDYRARTGTRLNLPIYYRNEAFTETQREDLWIEKIDKDERWIDGFQVKNASKNWQGIEALTKLARERSKRLGYGEPPDDDRKQYEKNLRILQQISRNKKRDALCLDVR